MNRSNSKIRHIQEANLKLEQSFVDSYFERDKAPDWVTNRFKETKPKVKTKPKTKSEIINFQNWVINTKKDKQILGKSGADGIWGQRSELAWNRYGADYVPTKTPVSTDPNKLFKTFDDVRKFQNWVINVKKDRKLIGSADGDWGPKTKSAWNKYGSEYIKSGGSKTITGEKTLVNKDTNRKFVNILNDKKLNPSDSVAIFPAGQEKCAQFVNDFADGIPEGNLGNAWIAHDNSSIGPLVYSSFHNLKPEDIKTAINYWLQLNKKGGGVEGGGLNGDIATFVKKLVPKSASVSLKLGDVVGLVYPTSKHYEEAFYEAGKIYFKKGSDGKMKPGKNISAGTGWGMNTHLGIVGAIKDGTPIIFHNIGGQVWADPANNMHGGCKVAWVRRRGSNPIAFNQLKSTDSGLTEEKKNDLNEQKTNVKYSCVPKEFRAALSNLISKGYNKTFLKVALGVIGRESSYASGLRYNITSPLKSLASKLGADTSIGPAQMKQSTADDLKLKKDITTIEGALIAVYTYLIRSYKIAKQNGYDTNKPTSNFKEGTGNAALDITIASYNMGIGRIKKYCERGLSKPNINNRNTKEYWVSLMKKNPKNKNFYQQQIDRIEDSQFSGKMQNVLGKITSGEKTTKVGCDNKNNVWVKNYLPNFSTKRWDGVNINTHGYVKEVADKYKSFGCF